MRVLVAASLCLGLSGVGLLACSDDPAPARPAAERDAGAAQDGDAVGADASPPDAADGAATMTVSSPDALPPNAGPIDYKSCTEANLGQLGVFDREHSHDDVVSVDPYATFCDVEERFGKRQTSWNVFAGVLKRSTFVDIPVQATWAGFVRFDVGGKYETMLSVELVETATMFIPICRDGIRSDQTPAVPRGPASAAEKVACDVPSAPWSARGKLMVRFIGGAPTGSYVPTGGTPVPVKFFAL